MYILFKGVSIENSHIKIEFRWNSLCYIFGSIVPNNTRRGTDKQKL